MKIKIADLDLSLQTRAGTDADTIKTYAEAMADGAQFPDVTVFTDGTKYWLADGFHRVMAAKVNGKAAISADVRKGTEDDAVVFGGTANNKQGKRPTMADVQHFLSMVWERREAIFGGAGAVCAVRLHPVIVSMRTITIAMAAGRRPAVFLLFVTITSHGFPCCLFVTCTGSQRACTLTFILPCRPRGAAAPGRA